MRKLKLTQADIHKAPRIEAITRYSIPLLKYRSNEITRNTSVLQRVLDLILYAFITFAFTHVVAKSILKLLGSDISLTEGLTGRILLTAVVILACYIPRLGYLLFGGITLLTIFSTLLSSSTSLLQKFNLVSVLRNILSIVMGSKNASYLATEVKSTLIYTLTILIALLIWSRPAPLALSALLIFPFIYASFSDAISLKYLVIGLFCLAAIYARHSNRRVSWRKHIQLPPVMLITCLIIFSLLFSSLLPSDLLLNKKLANYLEKRIQEKRAQIDHINYYEFSLRETGFYPEEKRLGGAIFPSQKKFLLLEGPEASFYLKGAVFEDFTGLTWQPTVMEPNYRFYNSRPLTEQTGVMYTGELEPALAKLHRTLFRNATLNIYPATYPQQIIFNPGKVDKIQMPAPALTTDKKTELAESYDASKTANPIVENENTVGEDIAGESKIPVFFNNYGQLYATQVLPMDGYQLQGSISLPLDEQLEQKISNSLQVGKTSLAQVAKQGEYRDAIEKYDPQLAQIVYSESKLQGDQLWQKLLAARNHLRSHYTYTLDTITPDVSSDFFAHFLETKRGYCTYFATAMTIIARELGVDAKYIEGFIVPATAEDSGLRFLLNDQAHAWAEVELAGVGNIILDSTPDNARADLMKETVQQQDQTIETTLLQSTNQVTTTSKQPFKEAPSRDHKLYWLLLSLLTAVLITILIYAFYRRRKYYLARLHDRDYLWRCFNQDQNALISYLLSDFEKLSELMDFEIAANCTVKNLTRDLGKKCGMAPQLCASCYRVFDQVMYANRMPLIEDVENLFTYYDILEKSARQHLKHREYFLRRTIQIKLPSKFSD